MRPSSLARIALIGCLIITAPAFGSGTLIVRDGRPIVDGVFVNGHGPYRFLLDTGSNVNLIESGLAHKIGMAGVLQFTLSSAAGATATQGCDGNEISLGAVKAANQRFLFSALDAIHNSSPDVRGVLGEWFLTQFDYAINLQTLELEFGSREFPGTRTPFHMINGRLVVSTSLGVLALDSGQSSLVLFGVQPRYDSTLALHTVAGSQFVGKVDGKPLFISGRKISEGEAIAIPGNPEPGIDGLLPLRLFHSIYVSNSEACLIFN